MSGDRHTLPLLLHGAASMLDQAKETTPDAIEQQMLGDALATVETCIVRSHARQVVKVDARNNADGAWTCTRCGYIGFWYGGPHCGPGAEADNRGNLVG